MPVWGWILLIACLSALTVAAVMAIVFGTHRLRSHAPLDGDPHDLAEPVPLDLVDADAPTNRERASRPSRRPERGPFSQDRIAGRYTRHGR